MSTQSDNVYRFFFRLSLPLLPFWITASLLEGFFFVKPGTTPFKEACSDMRLDAQRLSWFWRMAPWKRDNLDPQDLCLCRGARLRRKVKLRCIWNNRGNPLTRPTDTSHTNAFFAAWSWCHGISWDRISWKTSTFPGASVSLSSLFLWCQVSCHNTLAGIRIQRHCWAGERREQRERECVCALLFKDKHYHCLSSPPWVLSLHQGVVARGPHVKFQRLLQGTWRCLLLLPWRAEAPMMVRGIC